jgi:hypothetical protein
MKSNIFGFFSRVLCLGCISFSSPTDAAVVWFYDSNANDPSLTATDARQIGWKDTMVSPLYPNDINGNGTTLGVEQHRLFPALQDHAIFSFDGLFGTIDNGIPSDSLIAYARLYVHVNSYSGSQIVTIRGLSSADANWVENEASYNSKATGISWTGGNFAASLTLDNFGSVDNPTATGWLSINVTDALKAYQAGRIGGIALVSLDEGVLENNSFFVDSREMPGTGPGLLVDFTSVPEPMEVTLIGGLLSLGAMLRRRLKRTIRAANV